MRVSMRNIMIIMAALMIMPQLGRADGMIVMPHPHPNPIPLGDMYSVKYHKVNVEIRDQLATTTVDQIFVNETKGTIEVVYVFPLPRNAQVQKLSLFIGEKEVKGELMSREQARREYERIVRSNKDPALLEYLGEGLYKSSVFPIPAGGERKVKLVYSELLRLDGNRVEYLYPLNTEKFSKKPLNEVEVRFDLKTGTQIKTVYSPSHDVSPSWHNDKHVSGRYAEKNVRPEIDFRLFWSLSKKEVGATVFTYRPSSKEDGYFLLLASPEIGSKSRKVIKKNVILVLDKSGSMSGEKIIQARGAAAFIVRNLQEGDKFNVIFYDDSIDPIWGDLQEFNAKTKKEALDRIKATTADGSTDIHGALTTAMKMIPDDSKPDYIIFLTDGEPTAGVTTDPIKINEAVTKANTRNARLFAFGLGYNVNAILLDRLGASNHGLSEYVRPDEDIEGKVSRFYSKIQSPALTDVAVDFGGITMRDEFPRQLPDLFKGEQLILVGRYRKTGSTTIKITGTAMDKKRSFTYNVKFAKKTDPEEFAFVSRLWAQKKIGWLIEQIRLHGQKKEHIDEIVRLSIRYGILTEYTSFLADEEVDIHDRANVDKVTRNIDRRAKVASGRGGVSQSMQSKNMQNAAQTQNTATYYNEAGEQVTLTNVKVIGAKTFYLKKGVWTDSEYREGMKIHNVKQLSSPYFDLANQTPTQTKYITFTQVEDIIVVIDGKAYKITHIVK